jgi:hypothetical protein
MVVAEAAIETLTETDEITLMVVLAHKELLQEFSQRAK